MGVLEMSQSRPCCPRAVRLSALVGAAICVQLTGARAAAQVLVDLIVEGPATVMENSYADYTATAVFDDGREFEVTLFCDWSVDPDTYGAIDQFGRLTTAEVPEDQLVVVSASFTWDDVTLDDALEVTIIDVPDDPNGDPWPEFQRTASRLGRTSTIGPQTPTIAWRVLVDPEGGGDVLYTSQAVMDAAGRIFVGHARGLAAVDSHTHEILWQFPTSDNALAPRSVYDGKVLFGSPNDFFYCVDAATGREVWSKPAAAHPNRGSVVDERGVVYYPSQQDVLYARWVADGSEEWTHYHYDGFNAAPALDLDGLGQLYIGNFDFWQWLAFRTADAEIEWAFPLGGYPFGVSPVENGRVYVVKAAAIHSKLYCLNAETGQEIWSFPTEVTAGGGAAIRHDGVIYVNASGGAAAWLFAVTPDGDELWRYPITNQGLNQPPMIDGAGTAYFSTYGGGALGRVHALRADGTCLWVREMPHMVAATPMLAPDGTLYVMCKDKYLYAFKDPPEPSVEPHVVPGSAEAQPAEP